MKLVGPVLLVASVGVVSAYATPGEPVHRVAGPNQQIEVAQNDAGARNPANPSPQEIEKLRRKLMDVWYAMPHPERSEEPIVTLLLKLRRDGNLMSSPEVLSDGQSAYYRAAVDAAVRAAIKAQPYDMLSRQSYEAWKEIVVDFDPRMPSRPK
jgi:hypothetical protein